MGKKWWFGNWVFLSPEPEMKWGDFGQDFGAERRQCSLKIDLCD
jgi:hypothetical protein